VYKLTLKFVRYEKLKMNFISNWFQTIHNYLVHDGKCVKFIVV